MIVRKRCKRDTWYEQQLCCVVRTCQSEKANFDKSQFDNKHSFMVRHEHCKFCLQQIPHYGNTVHQTAMSQRRLIWAMTSSCDRNMPIWKNHTLINHNLITSIRSWLDMNIVSFACNKYLIMVTLCSSDSNVTETPDMNNDFVVWSKHANLSAHVISSR